MPPKEKGKKSAASLQSGLNPEAKAFIPSMSGTSGPPSLPSEGGGRFSSSRKRRLRRMRTDQRLEQAEQEVSYYMLQMAQINCMMFPAIQMAQAQHHMMQAAPPTGSSVPQAPVPQAPAPQEQEEGDRFEVLKLHAENSRTAKRRGHPLKVPEGPSVALASSVEPFTSSYQQIPSVVQPSISPKQQTTPPKEPHSLEWQPAGPRTVSVTKLSGVPPHLCCSTLSIDGSAPSYMSCYFSQWVVDKLYGEELYSKTTAMRNLLENGEIMEGGKRYGEVGVVKKYCTTRGCVVKIKCNNKGLKIYGLSVKRDVYVFFKLVDGVEQEQKKALDEMKEMLVNQKEEDVLTDLMFPVEHPFGGEGGAAKVQLAILAIEDASWDGIPSSATTSASPSAGSTATPSGNRGTLTPPRHNLKSAPAPKIASRVVANRPIKPPHPSEVTSSSLISPKRGGVYTVCERAAPPPLFLDVTPEKPTPPKHLPQCLVGPLLTAEVRVLTSKPSSPLTEGSSIKQDPQALADEPPQIDGIDGLPKDSSGSAAPAVDKEQLSHSYFDPAPVMFGVGYTLRDSDYICKKMSPEICEKYVSQGLLNWLPQFGSLLISASNFMTSSTWVGAISSFFLPLGQQYCIDNTHAVLQKHWPDKMVEFTPAINSTLYATATLACTSATSLPFMIASPLIGIPTVLALSISSGLEHYSKSNLDLSQKDSIYFANNVAVLPAATLVAASCKWGGNAAPLAWPATKLVHQIALFWDQSKVDTRGDSENIINGIVGDNDNNMENEGL